MIAYKKDQWIRLIRSKLAIFCMSHTIYEEIMSTEEPDSAKKIATEGPQSVVSAEPDTPEVGVGLIVLGGLCLVMGVVIGLVFAAK